MKEVDPPMTGEEIVISGISGVFPNSDSVQDFMNNLFNKVDMVSENPIWNSRDPELPSHVGKVSGIEKFDAQFFKVGFSQAQVLEPISKKLLEHAYGAIFDSGNTHVTLKGTIIGVFTGISFADYSSLCFFTDNIKTDFFVGGSSKSMLANRISYWIDGKGTSYNLDFSCASSIAALEKAVIAIKSGHCDAAIVGGGNLCTHSGLMRNLKKYGVLCLDGKTKCFDKDADGYVRAEAANVIFLQKAKNAKRIYAEVYHATGTYKLKPGSLFLPTRQTEEIEEFLKNVYADIDIDPAVVEYIEAHGSALAEADANELKAVAKLFASVKNVKIGCVKSNMGHSESVSGLCALIKLCLAYHKGQIPANLHYNNPQTDITAINEGKLKVVTENTDFGRKFTALNNFSLTGANFHSILKGHYKQKNINKYGCKIPRIVVASGRSESAVERIFDDLKQRPIDAEEISLLHDIFSCDITEHTERGYSILDTNRQGETVSNSRSIDYYSGIKRPLWFVYSGMGSQWAGMGADLMRIPSFAAAIEKCHKVLEPKGIDLIKVVTEIDNKIFDNILNAFVGIGAVQIGLTDILKDIGIIPDYIIGHSLGEMACAYHDDTITAEELILLTYSRGKAVLDANLQPGSMAAVGVGYKALSKWCPPDIDIGCHNSSESTTISGPIESMKKFVAELTAKGIFARAVPSGNIAYHSRYVADAGPELLRRLKIILNNPKKRSQKWISTSVPQENWDSHLAKYSSAEYHTNNLLSPVLFEEVSSMIPANAVVVEIAPHGLLQAILKRSHKKCTHIPLTKRGNMEGATFLLNAIGKLYLAGYNPKVSALYPKVEYPVSTETPLLSHLVEWEHSEDWPGLNKTLRKHTSPSRELMFSVYDDDYNFIQGYTVNGTTMLSEAALLVFVWETLAMFIGVSFVDLSVIFKDIQFHNTVIVASETPIRLTVMIMRGNDNFEVSQNGRVIVNGKMSGVKKLSFYHGIDDSKFKDDEIILDSDDVYKMLHAQGFDYSDYLKLIHQMNLEKNKALLKWTNNWVTFLDGLIKLNMLSKEFDGTPKIKIIRKIKICAVEQERVNQISVYKNDLYNVQIYKELDVTRCAGVEIDNIIFVDEVKVEKECDVFMSRSFYPFNNFGEIDIKSAIEINLQIATENSVDNNVTVMTSSSNTLSLINDVVSNAFYNNFEVKDIGNQNFSKIFKKQDKNKANVIFVENIVQDKMKIKILQSLISEHTFIMSIEDQVSYNEKDISEYFSVLSRMSDGNRLVVFMKKVIKMAIEDVIYIPVTMENKFTWVPKVFAEIETAKQVVLISERQPYCGLLGLVKKLKFDGYNNISVFVIDDFHTTKFNVENKLFKEQLNKNLIFNVMKKGQWGAYYYTTSARSTNIANLILKSGVPGDIDKLSWIEVPKLCGEKNIVQVYYTGISMNDYEKAVSINKKENEYFGMDFSGITKNGEKIMGVVKEGAITTSLEADLDLTWQVPGNWTLEDAATVPLPFITAYYCLKMRTQIFEKCSIFVTDAVSSLGQAIISICITYNCTIFATVLNEREQKTLLQIFPQLNDNNICYSGNDNFYQMIMLATNKNGCDIVINSSSGYLRTIAEYCVGEFGTYLDLSKHDMEANNEFKMGFLNMERSYKVVDVSNIFRPQFSKDKKLLHKYLNEGIAEGIVKPLNRTVFSTSEISKAFRLLSSQQFSRILVRMRDPNVSPQDLNAIPRIEFSAEDVLIIVCDESGIGVELAEKLIERGAKKLILHISSVSGYDQMKFLSWAKQEVSVKVSTENLQTERGCTILMKNATKFGKLRGIFIVFDSKYSDNGKAEEFVNAFNKKSLVVLNLNAVSRNCGELKHFVILSRMTQSASDEYALSLLERFCDLRNEMGLATLVLRFESLVEDSKETKKYIKLDPQSLSAIFNSLERGLKQKFNNILVKEINCKNKLKLANDGNHFEMKTGLSVFINEIVDEEIHIESQPIVELPTLISRNIESPTLFSQTIDVDNEVKNTGNCVIMIPGFESRSDVLKLLAERLKISAYCVQIDPDMIGNSFKEIAVNVLKAIKTKITTSSRFYILGYSLGVNIALELASLLENEGLVGILYCLGSSPSALKIQLNAHLGKQSLPELQNNILIHISQIISGLELEGLEGEIKKLETFEEKLYICLEELQKRVTFSKEYMRSVFKMTNQEILLAIEYEPDLKLKSEIVLIKGVPCASEDKMPNDYDLSKLSVKPVKMFEIPSDHASAPQDCRVPIIVNKFLDEKLLEEFKNKNLCDVYFSEV